MAYKNKEDQRAAARRHYEKNKIKMKARAFEHKKQMRLTLKEFVFNHLVGHPCVDCGESDPIVLEFDHRVAEDKKFNISNAVNDGLSVKVVEAEIAKCDVRCANCHRRRTYHQFGRNHRH